MTLPHILDKQSKFLLEVYMDDYITLAVATSQQQLNHIANATMYGIHDVFPTSPKKLTKKDGAWALVKDILGCS